MSDVTVTLDRDDAAYLPGETVSGTVRWQLGGPPRKLEVVLFWAMEGKGSPDSGVVEREEHDNPGMSGEVAFSFRLPEAPYSFSGQLISLHWGVEGIFKKEKTYGHQKLILSPTREEWVLPEPDPAAMEKRTGFQDRFFKSGR